MKNNDIIDEIGKIIKNNKTFSIYSHIRTDIDAVASSLAFRMALNKMGKVANVFIDSDLPVNSRHLIGANAINNEREKSYDVAIILDCNDETRLGRLKFKYRKNTKTTFQIDHHTQNPNFAKVNFVDEKASSTCEMVAELFFKIGIEIDKDIASTLLSGIYTDTGSLKFSNTTTNTLSVVGKLLALSKTTMDKITNPIFNSVTVDGFKLRKFCYNNLELFADNKIAIMTISADDICSLGVPFVETKSLIDIALQLESAKVVALMSENPEERGLIYVSLRTKDDYVARNIAAAFGGGGHMMASGCRIEGDIASAKEKVLNEMKKELERL